MDGGSKTALRDMRVPVLWLGADGGMETRLVPANDFPIETIAVRGLRGKSLASTLGAPFVVLRSLLQAIGVLRRVQPRAVISFGGFAAGPGGLAAWLLRRPLIVHEQNRAPGLTNRVLARVARRVLCGFPDSFAGVPNETVGNPVRPEIAALPSPAERFAGRSGPLRLLVLGGSQGARAINSTVPKVIASLHAEYEFHIVHQCGEKMRDDARRAYDEAGVSARIEAFITDMAAAYAGATDADEVHTREGPGQVAAAHQTTTHHARDSCRAMSATACAAFGKDAARAASAIASRRTRSPASARRLSRSEASR